MTDRVQKYLDQKEPIPSRLEELQAQIEKVAKDTTQYDPRGFALFGPGISVRAMFLGCVRTMRSRGEYDHLFSRAESWTVKRVFKEAQAAKQRFNFVTEPTPFTGNRSYARLSEGKRNAQCVYVALVFLVQWIESTFKDVLASKASVKKRRRSTTQRGKTCSSPPKHGATPSASVPPSASTEPAPIADSSTDTPSK